MNNPCVPTETANPSTPADTKRAATGATLHSRPAMAATERAARSSGAPALASPAAAASEPHQQQAAIMAGLRHSHELPFVAPSSFLRPKHGSSRAMSEQKALQQPSPMDKDQMQGLRGIREFLKVRTSYDVLPISFRLIVLDNDLLIKKSLGILIQNSAVTLNTDYINVIQYYCQFPEQINEVDKFRLSSLRDIEKAIGVLPLETVSVRPTRPLYEACRRMLKTRARRIPLVDIDDETKRETVVSVITQYRILKFIAVNNEKWTTLLKKPLRDLKEIAGLGTYNNLATCTMNSSVLDAIHLMVEKNISAVPILDENGRLLNVFEAVDVIPCIKGGAYDELSSHIGDALCRRPEDFGGIYTCNEDDRLDSIFDTIRKSRVHRLIVVDDESRLKGIISLSDLLKYVLLFGEEEDSIRAH